MSQSLSRIIISQKHPRAFFENTDTNKLTYKLRMHHSLLTNNLINNYRKFIVASNSVVQNHGYM